MFKYSVTLTARKGQVNFDSRYLTDQMHADMQQEVMQWAMNELQRFDRIDCGELSFDDNFDTINLRVTRRS